MMYKVEDEIDSDNEDVEENLVFGNEAERIAVLVQRWATAAKAKEQALLLFKQTEPNKGGVPHSYTIMIPKMKTKLFHLVIHNVSCGTFFRMAANIISCMCEVLSDPFLHFCTCHHMNNFIRVVCAVNLQCIFDILRRLWAFLLAPDSNTHQSTLYFDLRIRVYMEEHHTIANVHGCTLLMFQRHTGEVVFEMVFNFLTIFCPN